MFHRSALNSPIISWNDRASSKNATGGGRTTKAEKKYTKAKEKVIEFDIVKKRPSTGGLSVEYGEFTLDVRLYRNKTVKVSYGIPLDEDGKPGANADNIVFYAPYRESFFRRKNFWHI